MSGMTANDLDVLGAYARAGNRELYWNYLAQLPGNDGYGALALGVVRNDNIPGATANVFAQEVARRVNGIELSERQWQRFGVDLMEADFALRATLFDGGEPGLALNLPVRLVQEAHDRTFRARGIDVDAWTPRELLEAARHRGGEPAAEKVWQSMLRNNALGLQRGTDTLAAMAGYRDAPNDMADYSRRVTLARIAAGQVLPHTDPDRIGIRDFHHEYDASARRWSMVQQLDVDGRPQRHVMPERNASRIAELDDARAVRIQRLAMRDDFHPQDRFRTLLRSPQTLAEHEPDPLPPGVARHDDPRLPGHPGHALYRSVEAGVHQLDAQRGRTPDAASDRVTAALYALAVRCGYERVDHVVLGVESPSVRRGENVFIVQGGMTDVHNRVAWLPTERAIATPVEQSLNEARQAAQERVATQALAQAREQPPAQQGQALALAL